LSSKNVLHACNHGLRELQLSGLDSYFAAAAADLCDPRIKNACDAFDRPTALMDMGHVINLHRLSRGVFLERTCGSGLQDIQRILAAAYQTMRTLNS